MDNTRPRRPASVFVSLLMSLGLLVLFFMPWLRVSCNPGAASNAAELRGMEGVPEELTRPTVLASASGWDLARGELTPDDRFKEQARAAQENDQAPPAKHWAYGGLVLPVLLVGLALLCLSGKLTCSGAGKWMLALGIAGVVLMSVAASMDYIDEAMDQAKDQMAAHGAPVGCPAFQQNVAAATDQAKEIIQTKATPFLWASLGIYVLIAGCGLVTLGAPQYVPPSESATWQHDREPMGRDVLPGSAIPGRDSRAPSGPYGPIPHAPPTQAPAPVGSEKADSQS